MWATREESPAIDIADLLQRRGALVSYSDPFVPFINEGTVSLESIATGRGARGWYRLRRHHDRSTMGSTTLTRRAVRR